MAELSLFSIEVTKSYNTAEWREDLKAVLMKAGGQGEGTAFLMSDSQVKKEAFLEDINAILNTGEVCFSSLRVLYVNLCSMQVLCFSFNFKSLH